MQTKLTGKVPHLRIPAGTRLGQDIGGVHPLQVFYSMRIKHILCPSRLRRRRGVGVWLDQRRCRIRDMPATQK